MMKKILPTSIRLVLAILLLPAFSHGQVVLLQPPVNPVIKSYLKLNPDALLHKKSTSDTLDLPFFDDFAVLSVYPSTERWLDDYTFINDGFGDNPPSVGVATFDALNSYGEIYSFASTTPFIADILTSKPINLSDYTEENPISIPTTELFYFNTASGLYFPSDSLYYVSGANVLNCQTNPGTFTIDMTIFYLETASGIYLNVSDSLYYYDSGSSSYQYIASTISHNYQPSDSLYLSFYYQPQGLASNNPEASDSLVLQFKTPDIEWTSVWSDTGSTNRPFNIVLQPITDTNYMVKGFQFRFLNYASIGDDYIPGFNSNCDIWNIDYIYLNRNRSLTDTIEDDVCFISNLDSQLKEYQAVPWPHFKYDPSSQTDTFRLSYRNRDDEAKIVYRFLSIKNITEQTTIRDLSLGSENISALTDTLASFVVDTLNFFPSTNASEAVFELKSFLKTTNLDIYQSYRTNDTLYYYQHFSNYYAWDDGEPETGFGLTGSGTQNARLAYQFTTLKSDTLRGVNMFFNQTYQQANQKYFYLTVWGDANGHPGTVLYSQLGVRPEFEEGLNNFHYYTLDTVLYITGTFYIGWIQTSTDYLNIGYDMNHDASDKIFYNINGTWYNSPFPGAMLIRPVFSESEILQLPEITKTTNNCSIYPNPASNTININASLGISQNSLVEIFDISGRKHLTTSNLTQSIDISGLPSGMYMVRISGDWGTQTHKLIVEKN